MNMLLFYLSDTFWSKIFSQIATEQLKMMHYLLTALVLAVSSVGSAQTINKIFRGQWAMTGWTYEFHKDGTFSMSSYGRMSDSAHKGTYAIRRDTVHMLTGFNNANGAIHQYYLIDKDSMLIDLHNMYDYTPHSWNWRYMSKKRYDILKKPNIEAKVSATKTQLNGIVNKAITLLKTQKIRDIEDKDHLQIIRLINTIRSSSNVFFKTGKYPEFAKLVLDKNYSGELTALYEWIPNKSMGFFFRKLQIELGGTPNLYSLYSIKAESSPSKKKTR